ncbi:hypothetical protein DY000_02059177 [Brassica cretica]|uniref:Uncharacterized protein n=1 Tax=Brassica cretica TaxID=69181 RepID=A0ABQ7AXL9_BRACR|nr:hypothetical protein DY000_02059177 [Brassica cretica]
MTTESPWLFPLTVAELVFGSPLPSSSHTPPSSSSLMKQKQWRSNVLNFLCGLKTFATLLEQALLHLDFQISTMLCSHPSFFGVHRYLNKRNKKRRWWWWFRE